MRNLMVNDQEERSYHIEVYPQEYQNGHEPVLLADQQLAP